METIEYINKLGEFGVLGIVLAISFSVNYFFYKQFAKQACDCEQANKELEKKILELSVSLAELRGKVETREDIETTLKKLIKEIKKPS